MDNLQDWRLIRSPKEWNELVEALKTKHKKGGRGDEVIHSVPKEFPVIARALYPSDDKRGPWYPRIEVFDDVELTIKFLRLTLQKENNDIAFISFTSKKGPIKLVISGDISSLLQK